MILAAASLSLSGCAHDQTDASLAEFEANLAAHASATRALEQWCESRGIADPATISAVPVAAQPGSPPEDLYQLLRAPAETVLGYRHVQLTCGDKVLSEAHNWYVPTRLTAEMNRQLNETNVPFGKVAAALNFTREPLASARRGDPACPAGAISTHRALLRLPDGQPLALVVECYTEENLKVSD